MLRNPFAQILASLIVIACVSLIGTAAIVKMFPLRDGAMSDSNSTPSVTPTKTPQVVSQKTSPVALPANEFPLSSGLAPVIINCAGSASNNFGDVIDFAIIAADGQEKHCTVYSWYGAKTRAEQLVSFKLRTNERDYVSVHFLGKYPYANNYFLSAVMLCPDEDSLKRWTAWYAATVAENRARMTLYDIKAREQHFPSRVLPPPWHE